jgi:FtsP/CotA-like multicopper oxidase with cupredoxin domain
MVFADKVFDEDGILTFDLMNLDGILGDKFLVNGRIQPFFHVKPRRYRFRWLNTGPSRFYEFFLTDLKNLGDHNLFWQISNDGNLLPHPVQVESVRIGVAERMDVIIDFSQFAGKTIYLENRLRQLDGRGPLPSPDDIKAAGAGDLILRFDIDQGPAKDESADPAATKCYDLPDITPEPAVTRTFRFDRLNGQWSVNGTFMDCNTTRFKVRQNTVEHWVLTNLSGDWQHPVHIHLEEHQIMTRNRKAPPLPVEVACRKDVTRLQQNERVQMFFRFRDFHGKYPLHCHNVVHEDHSMMMVWEVDADGDTKLTP